MSHASAQELTPGPILSLSAAYWGACALHAGVSLDVFSPLSAGPRTAGELADRLSCDERALAMLLNALTALGLLKREGQAYGLTGESAAFLVRGKPGYVGPIIRHHRHLLESFGLLPEAVRTGSRVRGGVQWTEADREDFLLGMFNMAMGIAPRLAPLLDGLLREAGLPGVPARGRLLDLGGGPGTYAIHFCLAHPGLTATLFDLPTTRPFAEATIERFGLAGEGVKADRIVFTPGDYTADPVHGAYDLAWLSHILHGEAPDMAARIVRKAAGALVPGGVLMIHEFLLDDSLDGPEFPTLFSLNMLLGTDGGQAYSGAQLSGMLAAAGLTDIRQLGFTGPNNTRIVAGRKP
jgi:SAM-dependent methyltransferase